MQQEYLQDTKLFDFHGTVCSEVTGKNLDIITLLREHLGSKMCFKITAIFVDFDV